MTGILAVGRECVSMQSIRKFVEGMYDFETVESAPCDRWNRKNVETQGPYVHQSLHYTDVRVGCRSLMGFVELLPLRLWKLPTPLLCATSIEHHEPFPQDVNNPCSENLKYIFLRG